MLTFSQNSKNYAECLFVQSAQEELKDIFKLDVQLNHQVNPIKTEQTESYSKSTDSSYSMIENLAI